MRFSTSKQLHINDHLKHIWGTNLALGTKDLVHGGTQTHDLVVESPVR